MQGVAEAGPTALESSGASAPTSTGRTSGSPQRELAPVGFFTSLRVLGQARSMLLVCEGSDALYVLDQHAADERVRFARLLGSFRARAVQTQRLLFPERVEVSEDEGALVEEHAEALAGLGLECRLLGPTTAAVSAVPSLLHRAAPERLLRDVLGELSRKGERSFSDAIDMALATMACHAAIRAGDPLSIEQAEALLRNLDSVEDFAGHCPHGRPIAHRIAFDELERRLGR
jgi:DNA mismatch repair protein MutL